MNHNALVMRCAAAALCAFTFAAAQAATRGSTDTGRSFVTGGVGQAEARQLRADWARYSLWVVTAARPSGAYLADVHVLIRDADGRTVFDQALDGPWLMIDLPPGRYAIDARRGRQTRHQIAEIGRHAKRQIVFRFDSTAGVRPRSAAMP